MTHFARAHVDRDATGETGTIRFIAATEGRKADGIDLRMAGAQLERYTANPIVGYGHSYWGRENLPIGRAVGVEVDGDRLLIDVEFDHGDPFAVELERKYRASVMNAVSIGFDVNEWESVNDSYWHGGVALKWTLTELSCVPVPMDDQAVVLAGRSAGVDFTENAALYRAFLGFLRRTAEAAAAPPETPAPAPVAPPEAVAEGVDPIAARALLAALTPEGDIDE